MLTRGVSTGLQAAKIYDFDRQNEEIAPISLDTFSGEPDQSPELQQSVTRINYYQSHFFPIYATLCTVKKALF